MKTASILFHAVGLIIVLSRMGNKLVHGVFVINLKSVERKKMMGERQAHRAIVLSQKRCLLTFTLLLDSCKHIHTLTTH